ncbi:MAG: Cell division protein FtsQ [Frankiales bacterium]|nr:Cell division protein FtsQ [Frankiales bacterium]
MTDTAARGRPPGRADPGPNGGSGRDLGVGGGSSSRGRRVGGVRGWLVLVLLLLLAAVLTWVVAFSSVLGVASVRVRGNTTLSAAAVVQRAAIRSGTPLVRLDTSAARARVLAIPQVKSATVTTSYPNTVTITITQRTAVGYRAVGGGQSLVDADNVAFEQAAAAPKGLPRLVAGANAADDAAAAAVAGALTHSLAVEVAQVTAPTPESVTLTLADGRVVLWGGTDRGADKARLLSALLGQPGRYFDISDPDTVISR